MLKTWGGLAAPEPAIGVFQDGINLRGGIDLRIFDLDVRRRPPRTLLVAATFAAH
jgi:hypothetical protein